MLYFLPEISEEDDSEFRRLVTDFPATREAWLKLRRKQGKRMENQGDTLKAIDLSPDDFTKHCDREAATRDLSSLWACAQEKGRKQVGPI